GPPEFEGITSAATSSAPTVRKAKMDAVWLTLLGRRITGLFLLFFDTDHSSSSSSRPPLAEAIRASWRWAAEQYCWSTSLRKRPIFFPQRKQSIRAFGTSPILPATPAWETVLSEESLRV